MKIIPVYIVVDRSGSMGRRASDGLRPIDIVRNLPSEILKAYHLDPVIAEEIRLSVISYAETTNVEIRLGSIRNLEDLHSLTSGGNTYFGEAFKELKQTIDRDMNTWEASAQPGDKTARPIVIFFSDGKPSDPTEIRDAQFRTLCPIDESGHPDRTKSKWYPNMYMAGVGDSVDINLERYVFGKGQLFPRLVGGNSATQVRHAITICSGTLTVLSHASNQLTDLELEDDDVIFDLGLEIPGNDDIFDNKTWD